MTALRGELHSGVRGARLRNAFVISQVAVSLILMYPMMVASWIGLLLSGVALALSVSGLYGVVTYGLSQRVKEIGIRMALGATPSGIVRLVMRQSGGWLRLERPSD